MTTSPSSGLSPEAKEFVPLVQNPLPTIPLFVDEHTVASIYPSDQQTLMVPTVYSTLIRSSKEVEDGQLPEIEFHIQPSQQQQFQIDSCANIPETSSANRTPSTSQTSHIFLLPTTSSASGIGPAYYSGPQLIFAATDPLVSFLPMDFCEQPVISFSPQQTTQITKSNRLLSQHQRPNSFRQQHETNRPSSRGGYRSNLNNNTNRNSYYDYNNRRNGSSYAQNSGRGNSSNSKRTTSSYHQHDYNNYYHTSSRSRGYLPRANHHHHDEHRNNHYAHYNHDGIYYENNYQQSDHINDDGTPFEFRPEDFPSLPINNQQSDKTPTQSAATTNAKSTSSWNAIVSSTPRPHSTSPHSISQNQEQRPDRSRSFNNKSSTNSEKNSSHKKTTVQISHKSPTRSSRDTFQNEEQTLQSQNNDSSQANSNQVDDGFIQTKQQHRRLKRKNKMKDDLSTFSIHQSATIESIPYVLDDENAFPTLKQNLSSSITNNNKTGSDSNVEYEQKLNDMFTSLSTSIHVKNESTDQSPNEPSSINNPDTNDFKQVIKTRKINKIKRISNKDIEENKNIETQYQLTVDKTSNKNTISNDTNKKIENENQPERQSLHPLSSSSNDGSDTSDYDDAVDNFDDE